MSCHHTRVSIDLEMDLSRITSVVALQVFKNRRALGPSSIQIRSTRLTIPGLQHCLIWTMNVFQLHEAAAQSQLSNLSSIAHQVAAFYLCATMKVFAAGRLEQQTRQQQFDLKCNDDFILINIHFSEPGIRYHPGNQKTCQTHFIGSTIVSVAIPSIGLDHCNQLLSRTRILQGEHTFVHVLIYRHIGYRQ